MRIFLAEDAALIRAGIQEILQSAGHEVVATAHDTIGLREGMAQCTAQHDLPDLLITDVRMPPNDGSDDGLRAAIDLRMLHPTLAVVILSAHVSSPYVRTLLQQSSTAGVGYLLKERVGHVDDFLRALETVRSGGIVVDPDVIAHAMSGSAGGSLQLLTTREREVLALMAQGLSNSEISQRLFLSSAATSKHIANIFQKLDLPPGQDNRRVRAVLTWIGQPTHTP